MDGIGGAGVFWWKTFDSTKSERGRERERLFGCLNVLKVYRLRCFKKTEILSGGGGGECEFYTYTPTLLYTWKEDSKKEKKKVMLLL